MHYAHKIGNNRTVDIILSNMADIEENNSEHYCSVMPEMIDIKSFTKTLVEVQRHLSNIQVILRKPKAKQERLEPLEII